MCLFLAGSPDLSAFRSAGISTFSWVVVLFFLFYFIYVVSTRVSSQCLNRSLFVPRFLRRYCLCATVTQRQVFEFWGDFISAFFVSFFTLKAFVLSVPQSSVALLCLFKITKVHHEITSWLSREGIKRKLFFFFCFFPDLLLYVKNIDIVLQIKVLK